MLNKYEEHEQIKNMNALRTFWGREVQNQNIKITWLYFI